MERRPCQEVKRRWHDIAITDVKAIDAGDDWYHVTKDLKVWKAVWRYGISALGGQYHLERHVDDLPTSTGYNLPMPLWAVLPSSRRPYKAQPPLYCQYMSLPAPSLATLSRTAP